MLTDLIIFLCLLSSFKFTYQVAISRDLSKSSRDSFPEPKHTQEIEDNSKWLLPDLPYKINRTDVLHDSSGIFLNSIYSYIVEELPEDGFIPETLNMYDIDKLQKSNMLITFQPKLYHENQKIHQFYNRINKFWFDVTRKLIKINNERIIAAELRIYRNSSLAKIRGSKISISAYCVDFYKRKTSIKNNISVIVDDDYSGWVRFNLTDCFKYWTKYPQDNEGVQLTATLIDDDTNAGKIRFKDLGMSGFSRIQERRPFLIGYFKDNRKINFYREMKKKNMFTTYSNNNNNNEADGKNSPGCNLKSKFVDLDQSDKFWVIAPRKYYTNYCAGSCGYLRVNNYYGYNYNWRNNYQRSTETCRPRRWKGKPFFYYINTSNYVLKYIYDNVASCECQ